MTLRGLLPWFATLLGVVVVVGAAATFMLPAVRDSQKAVALGEDLVPEIRARRGRYAGDLYKQSLIQARENQEALLVEVRGELYKQTLRLGRWFPRVESALPGEPPPRDAFRDAYAFYQDELVREVGRTVKERTGATALEVPLYRPPFQQEGRLPRDTEEMHAAQVAFNVERQLLLQAARVGAVPTTPAEIRTGRPGATPEGLFAELEVMLHLVLPETVLPQLLRTLRDLGGEGPIIKIDSLVTRPAPLPERLEASVNPSVLADIRLIVGQYIGTERGLGGGGG